MKGDDTRVWWSVREHVLVCASRIFHTVHRSLHTRVMERGVFLVCWCYM